MAAYKVTEAREDKYTIVDSDSKTYNGKVEGDVFVRDDGKEHNSLVFYQRTTNVQFFVIPRLEIMLLNKVILTQTLSLLMT